MDCTDIFDLSTEELLGELSSGNHQSDGQALNWRHRLIHQELQERQGSEDLALQLLPSPPPLPPAKLSSPTDIRGAPVQLSPSPSSSPLISTTTSLSNSKLQYLSNSEHSAKIPEETAPSLSDNEQGPSFSPPGQLNSRQAAANIPLRDTTTAPTQKRAFAAPHLEGSKTARASILTEIVIGASPVMSSPRRRSSLRKKPDGETPRKGQAERGEGAKENAEKKRDVARVLGGRTIGELGRGGEKKDVKASGNCQKRVESSGEKSSWDAPARSGAAGGVIRGKDVNSSNLSDLTVGPKLGTELGKSGDGEQEGNTQTDEENVAAVLVEALPGIGDLGVYRAGSETVRISTSSELPSECLRRSPASQGAKSRNVGGSMEAGYEKSIEHAEGSGHEKLSGLSGSSERAERAGGKLSKSTEFQQNEEKLKEVDTLSSAKCDPVTRSSSAETMLGEASSGAHREASEVTEAYQASEGNSSEGQLIDGDVRNSLPERSEREALETDASSAPQGTSFESRFSTTGPASKALEGQLDSASLIPESEIEPEPSASQLGGEIGKSSRGVVTHLERGALAEDDERDSIPPKLAAPAVSAGQNLDHSSGVSQTEPTTSAVGSGTLVSAVVSQTDFGSLTRFEQIFTRFAPGAALSKEGTARPGPALQQFYKDVAQCLDTDAQLLPDLPGGPGLRTSDVLLLRVDAGDHSEVADLLASCARVSGAWAVDADARSTTWNVLWTWAARPRVDYSELLTWQRVNHFPNSKQLTRKDLLKGHLARFSRAANSLMPTTFTLPREYVAFVRAFSDGRTDVRDPSEPLAAASASAPDVSKPSGKPVLAADSDADVSGPFGKQAAASESANDVNEASERQSFASGVDADGSKGGGESLSAEETSASPDCSNVWIMKPVGRSRGEGIFLVSDICHVAYGEAMVVQKYVEHPLLLHGHKFDLRLYVLVTSFNPLEAFLYQEGFARFASRPYELTEASLTDPLVHLTNTEVQKQRDHVPSFLLYQSDGDTCRRTSADYHPTEASDRNGEKGGDAVEEGDCITGCSSGPAKADGAECKDWRSNRDQELIDTENSVPNPRRYGADLSKGSSLERKVLCASGSHSSRRTEAAKAPESEVPAQHSEAFESLYGGCKFSLTRAFALMVSHGVNVDRLWRRITALVLQSLEAVQTAIPANRNCFELFGYDVLVDETQRPWLVEVNSSPSMETGTPLDCALKGALIRDTLALVEPLPFDRPSLASVLRRRASPLPSVKRFGAKTDRPQRYDPDLHNDLDKILNGRRQRRWGDLPARLGNYQRIAPSNPHKKQAPKGRVVDGRS
ncbi:Tubulin-tyrosine ligase family protein [Klebsormidium nitens]|uniref:Tubulin-tyrosine ligase family protein n=1 Tax=Klebsormidium nitens TaxID=105231 RepID=A0A1Y1IE94_KLENI|nr:Tubulin-tyrosine ligase family protein [Klebsormidium nitens]|eukprot:GAQ88282.1 Tubulin-tyrosine ligase family protein [Klebsormidium nitens]